MCYIALRKDERVLLEAILNPSLRELIVKETCHHLSNVGTVKLL